MAHGKEGPVACQQSGPLMKVNIGPVGEVDAEPFEVVEQREFVAEKVGGPLGPGLGVGTVKRDNAGPVLEIASTARLFAVVEGVFAPQVVGLPCGHAVLEHEGGGGGIVADGQRHVLLLAPLTLEFQEVISRRPRTVHIECEGRIPLTRHRVHTGAYRGGRLGFAGHRIGLENQPTAETLVVAHPKGLQGHGLRRGVDEHGDLITGYSAHLARVALH